MTMLDDQLTSLLARAAEEFELPATGPSEIVLRARAGGSERTAAEDGTDDAPVAGEGGGDAAETSGDAGAPSRWREGRLRRAGAAAASHRVLTAAACVVVLLVAVGIGGAISRGTPGPTATSSLRPVRSAAPPRGVSPSTTTPPPGFSTEHAPSAGTENAKSATGQPSLTVPSTTSLAQPRSRAARSASRPRSSRRARSD